MRKVTIRADAGSRVVPERRRQGDRRKGAAAATVRPGETLLRVPTFTEQAVQFITRYLFCDRQSFLRRGRTRPSWATEATSSPSRL